VPAYPRQAGSGGFAFSRLTTRWVPRCPASDTAMPHARYLNAPGRIPRDGYAGVLTACRWYCVGKAARHPERPFRPRRWWPQGRTLRLLTKRGPPRLPALADRH
jgi:hypothetical protein